MAESREGRQRGGAVEVGGEGEGEGRGGGEGRAGKERAAACRREGGGDAQLQCEEERGG